jgi:hypothetical protein
MPLALATFYLEPAVCSATVAPFSSTDTAPYGTFDPSHHHHLHHCINNSTKQEID